MVRLLFPLADLEEMRDSLYAQLDKGYKAIEEKVKAGEDTREYEGYWKDLHEEYHMVVENIRKELIS